MFFDKNVCFRNMIGVVGTLFARPMSTPELRAANLNRGLWGRLIAIEIVCWNFWQKEYSFTFVLLWLFYLETLLECDSKH